LVTSKVSTASAGAGVRMLFTKQIRMALEMAKPLTEPVLAEGAQEQDMRFFFGLNIGF
jgi:hypothetical protein